MTTHTCKGNSALGIVSKSYENGHLCILWGSFAHHQAAGIKYSKPVSTKSGFNTILPEGFALRNAASSNMHQSLDKYGGPECGASKEASNP